MGALMTAEVVLRNTEIPRDRYQRPCVVLPEDEGKTSFKRVPYRRVTTFVGALEDQYAFRQRDKRLVVYGVARRPDLSLAASALSLDDVHKKKLQAVADDAYEVAQGSAAATIGTALHGHTETYDRGLPLGFVPPPYDKDLDAYRRATEGIEWLSVECFRVHDNWAVAGTADRIGRRKGERPQVYDVKTGQSAIDYPHGMAAQLALYSRCQPYDVETDTRSPIEEELDQNRAVIIWLPAGRGICELHEVDIGRGWGACLIAKQVWSWRSTKNLIEPWRDHEPPPTWRSLIKAAATKDELRLIWSQAHASGRLTPQLRGMLTQRAQQLSGNE